MLTGTYPILSAHDAGHLEAKLFHGDEAKEWPMMVRAGAAIGAAVMEDGREIGGLAASSRILVVVGKGHNGGDALIAAEYLLNVLEEAVVDVLFVFGERKLRPLTIRAWQNLAQRHRSRVATIDQRELRAGYDLCLDGIFGFSFHPPVDVQVQVLIERLNELPIGIRAAVDLPSAGLFRADFTYATGVVKFDAVAEPSGRLRFLDLGFFDGAAPGVRRVLTTEVLKPLAELRSSRSDKRTYGHLFVIGGSRSYPGAVMMAVMAALRSGVGLLTAFVPESLVAAFAARVPEAIWVGCPEAPDGGLALDALHLIRERVERATAWVIGPGIGRAPETNALIAEIIQSARVPVLLDADALQREPISRANVPLVLTPHAGEFARISDGEPVEVYAAKHRAVVVLKGPFTLIASGVAPTSPNEHEEGTSDSRAAVYHSFFGGPVLARGGSGDLLAGMIGGLLAQTPTDPLSAAVRGTVWHGLAADLLARSHGQIAVTTTQLLDHLQAALVRALEK